MALGSNIIKKEGQKGLSASDNPENVADIEPVDGDYLQGEDGQLEQLEEKRMLLVFPINNVSYALPIGIVKEIVPMPAVISMPQVTKPVIGAANIRGNVVAILDLNDQSESQVDHKYAMVVKDDNYKVALAVMEMPRTISVNETEFKKPDSVADQNLIEKACVQDLVRVDTELVMVVDIIGIIEKDRVANL